MQVYVYTVVQALFIGQEFPSRSNRLASEPGATVFLPK